MWESRYTNGDNQLYPSLVKELVDLRVDAILASGDVAAVAAFNATRSIPIVIAASAPVELGLAKSLASPGGNLTGVVYQSLDYSGKELDLIRAIQPGLKLMGLVVGDNVVGRAWYAGWQAAADRTGVTLVKLPRPARVIDIEATLVAARRERVQAIQFGLHHGMRGAGWQQITAWAISNKVLTASAEYARGEAAVAFGANTLSFLAQMADQLDRVLRGANPAQTPIQQPIVFDLIINRKIIRAMGLTVPQSVLVQATEVID